MDTKAHAIVVDPPAELWATIPTDAKKLLLSNVWCDNCSHEVTITNSTGVIKAKDLALVGLRSECHGDVAGLIEMDSRRTDD